MNKGFGEDFVWGAATAAYQIEGAAEIDGKGLSIWDTFCREKGRIIDGSSGEVACDHYHLYEQDVKLMADLGLQAYRMSLSWSRIFPANENDINEAGLAFYDRLIDALLEHGVTPYITLFHWDLPQWAYERGGWLNEDIPLWFQTYTETVVKRYSDRVRHWFTLNEPQCFIGHGMERGEHAPGLKLDFHDLLQATHYALLSHGRAVRAIRQYSVLESQVGAAPTGSGVYPKENTPENVKAAYDSTFSVPKKSMWNFAWYTDPIFLGAYPEDGLALYGDAVPEIKPGDMELISQPLDFCGLNLYNGWQIDAAGKQVDRPQGAPITAFKWPVTPEALYWTPKFFHQRYGLPIYITENGCSSMDWVDVDGKVRDYGRIDFLRRYLTEFRRAAEDGVPLKGYFLWSLMDNFEWAYGYTERFGIIHVDYQTRERTLKESAKWYQKVIQSNGDQLQID
jgi:beta-glucosidase